MIRRILLTILLLAAGTGVVLLFHYNRDPVTVHIGEKSAVELPLAAHLLIALAIGAGLVLLIDLARSMVGSLARAQARRRKNKAQAVDRIRQEGHRQLWAGDFKGAGKKLARAAGKEPEDLGTQLALARSLEELGELHEAQTILEKARALHGPDPVLLSRLGNLAMAQGNAGAAIAAFREAVAARPESPRLLGELTTALAAEGNFTEAVESARRRLSLERQADRHEKAKRAWIALRYQAAMAQEASKEGQEGLRRIVQEEPSFLPALIELAARARADGDVRTADRIYRESLRRKPTGAVLEQFREFTAGSREASRTIGLLREICTKSELAGPRLALARMLVRADQLDEAEAELAELSRESTAKDRAGIDIAPERDLVAGEIALARGSDREAARVLLRAATRRRAPFSHTCRDCGRTTPEWVPSCACGSYGSYDWSVNGAEKEAMQRGQAA